MPKGTILFADNDSDFLTPRKEFLEREGYQVLVASDPVQAKHFLEVEPLDLAILDIRLHDDNDERDISGLLVAEQVAPFTSKIILTGFPSYEDVRRVLGLASLGFPIAVDFLDKREGLRALSDSVRKALSSQSVCLIDGYHKAVNEVARFIKKIGLRVIIFREINDILAQQLEKHANVSFIVVLFTHNSIEIEITKDNPQEGKVQTYQKLLQNLSNFLDKYGRNKMVILYKEGIKLYLDNQGVLCIPIDSNNGWILNLAKEMRKAGIDLDLNRVI